MALRVLTSQERQLLQGSSEFMANLSWAIRDYADYWSIHSGAGLTDSERLRWAKDRFQAQNIILFDISDPALGLKAVKLAKGMQFDLPSAPMIVVGDPQAEPPIPDREMTSDEQLEVILSSIAANKYEELAGMYFQLEGKKIQF